LVDAARAHQKNNKNEKDYILPTDLLDPAFLRNAKKLRGPKQKTGGNPSLVPGRESAKAKKQSLDCHEHRFCGHAAGLCDSIGSIFIRKDNHGKKQKAPKTFEPKEHQEPQKTREEGATEPSSFASTVKVSDTV